MGLLPYSGIQVSMVLNSKDIPLNLYLEYQPGRHMKHGLHKGSRGGRETREPVLIRMIGDGPGLLS